MSYAPTYTFTVRTVDGIVLTWTGLTKREATFMAAMAAKYNPLRSSTELRSVGWKEEI